MKTIHFAMFKSNIIAKKIGYLSYKSAKYKIIVNFYEGFHHEGDKRLIYFLNHEMYNIV
jgi:hypothetical protein